MCSKRQLVAHQKDNVIDLWLSVSPAGNVSLFVKMNQYRGIENKSSISRIKYFHICKPLTVKAAFDLFAADERCFWSTVLVFLYSFGCNKVNSLLHRDNEEEGDREQKDSILQYVVQNEFIYC